MERGADFDDHIPHAVAQEANHVFADAAALHAAVDVFDPDAPPGQVLVAGFLLVRESAAARFLDRCEARDPVECEGQEAEILQ